MGPSALSGHDAGERVGPWWVKAKKLSLNVKKTHYMIFHRKKTVMPNLKIQIDNQDIDQVYKTKFLGVVIDWKLTWKDHIALVTGKLSKSICVITKARRCLNWKSLLTLYYSFIYPYLTYCNHVWGSTYVTNFEKLFVLQIKNSTNYVQQTKTILNGPSILWTRDTKIPWHQSVLNEQIHVLILQIRSSWIIRHFFSTVMLKHMIILLGSIIIYMYQW